MKKRLHVVCFMLLAVVLADGVVRGGDREEIDHLSKTLVNELKQYQQATGPYRKTAATQAISTLLKISRLRAINDEPFLAEDAITQANRIATDAAAEMLPVIKNARMQNIRMAEAGKEKRRLVKILKSNPNNLSARKKLVLDILVLTLDRPGEAKQYLAANMNPATISRVNLAAGNAEKYPPQAVLELADLYYTLVKKATPDQLPNVLTRAKTYYELYRRKMDNSLDEKTLANIDEINALLKKNRINVDLTPILAEAKDSDISTTVAHAKKYLVATQLSDGAFPPFATEFDVTTAQWPTPLITHALLKAGIPAKDPVIRNALKFMSSHKSDNVTYQAMLCSLLSMPAVRDAKTVRKLAEKLQIVPDADTLITRHCITMALNDATSAGGSVKRIHWIKTLNLYRGSQNPDGGWGFSANRPTKHIPTLIATIDMTVSLRQLGKTADEINEHPNVKKAMQWLAKNFDRDILTDQVQYYYLISELAETRQTPMIDNRDSLKWATEELLHVQEPDGSWKANHNSPHVTTAMAILCLTAGK